MRRWALVCAAIVVPVQVSSVGHSDAAIAGTLIQDHVTRGRGSIAIVGDSLTYSYITDLPTRLREQGWGPFAIEARSTRKTLVTTSLATSGLEAVRRIRATGFEPRVWIIALGTNDMIAAYRTPGLAASTIDGMMAELGQQAKVVWVNTYSKFNPSATTAFNAALEAARPRHSNLVTSDWYSLVVQHPGWIVDDGIHTTLTGAIARNEWVSLQAINRWCTAAPAYVPVAAGTAASGVALAPATRLCR